MKRVLIVYATREGHTRKVADHIAATIRARDREVDAIDAAALPPDLDLARYQLVVLAASLHMGKYEREIIAFAKGHHGELDCVPTAFLSVSLAEATIEDETRPQDVRIEAGRALKGHDRPLPGSGRAPPEMDRTCRGGAPVQRVRMGDSLGDAAHLEEGGRTDRHVARLRDDRLGLPRQVRRWVGGGPGAGGGGDVAAAKRVSRRAAATVGGQNAERGAAKGELPGPWIAAASLLTVALRVEPRARLAATRNHSASLLWDRGNANLDASTIASKFWELSRARAEVRARIA